jgi:hypothetical protein
MLSVNPTPIEPDWSGRRRIYYTGVVSIGTTSLLSAEPEMITGLGPKTSPNIPKMFGPDSEADDIK